MVKKYRLPKCLSGSDINKKYINNKNPICPFVLTDGIFAIYQDYVYKFRFASFGYLTL